MPKVSIIMPALNMGQYISQAIDSIFKQNFQDWELIVVNDGSIDDTKKIVKDLSSKDPRIKYSANDRSRGLAFSLNKGVALAAGEYIARLDCDDYWSDENKLKDQVDFLETNSDTGLVGTWAQAVDMDGRQLFKLEYPVSDKEIRERMLIQNCFVHSSVLFRKKLVDHDQAYDPKQIVEDYELWLRLGLKAKLANIPKLMVVFRVNPKGYTISKNKQGIKSILSLLIDYKNYYPSFWKGEFKWLSHLLILYVFGPQFWLRLRKIYAKS